MHMHMHMHMCMCMHMHTSPHISPHLVLSSYISPHLPASPRISPHLVLEQLRRRSLCLRRGDALREQRVLVRSQVVHPLLHLLSANLG